MHQKKQLHFYEDQNKKSSKEEEKQEKKKNTQNKNSLHFSFICLIILL